MTAERVRGKGLGPGRGSPSWPDETRRRALELSDQRGIRVASDQLGIPYNTIKMWRRKTGHTAPRAGVDADAWAKKKQAGAQETFTTARSALTRVRELIEAGDERKAKDAALTMAILLDKSAALEQASILHEERRARINKRQGELVANVITQTFSDLGLDVEDARSVLRHYLIQASKDGVLTGPAPGADAARQKVRTRAAEGWEESLPREERLALLAGEEGETENGSETEVVDGEVVETSEDEIDQTEGQRPDNDKRNPGWIHYRNE